MPWPRDFAHWTLQARFTVLAGTGFVLLACATLGAIVWLQGTQMEHSLEEFSASQLDSLDALISTAMNNRPDDPSDVGIKIYNEWFRQRNSSTAGDHVWSVWSPKVQAYMAETAPKTPPKLPQDDIDREALATGRTVARLLGDNYRMSKPIVLGGTAGTNRETCHACHEAMELRTGDVIAVLSSTVNIAAERQRERGILGVLLAAGLVVTIGGVVALRQALVRLVTGPVGAITGQVGRLAEGQLDIAVTGTERQDEIGIMARAFGHLRDSLSRARDLEAGQREEAEAKARRAEKVAALVRDFESMMRSVVGRLAASATELQASSARMLAASQQTRQLSASVASASDTASGNVQAAAGATEQLTASSREIGTQMERAMHMAEDAVAETRRTGTIVDGLAETTRKIGAVVELIQQIAAQTNLLALNATIEAARAGEAGRGFAVVAGEVKSLAGQTARATLEINAQITGVREASDSTVDAIRGIGSTIDHIKETSTSMAAAVEEQIAATGEIARSVQQAAQGTVDISGTIAGVAQAAEQTGLVADTVLTAADQLSEQAKMLRKSVEEFLAALDRA